MTFYRAKRCQRSSTTGQGLRISRRSESELQTRSPLNVPSSYSGSLSQSLSKVCKTLNSKFEVHLVVTPFDRGLNRFYLLRLKNFLPTCTPHALPVEIGKHNTDLSPKSRRPNFRWVLPVTVRAASLERYASLSSWLCTVSHRQTSRRRHPFVNTCTKDKSSVSAVIDMYANIFDFIRI